LYSLPLVLYSELYRKDKNLLHAPEKLLGDFFWKPEHEWPKFDDLQRKDFLRETPEYEDLLFHFMKEVMLDSHFKMNATRNTLSKYMNKSLEAYLVLTYINSYDSWLEECKKQDVSEQEGPTTLGRAEEASVVSALTVGTAGDKRFTSHGRGSGKFKGWSSANGIALYNALLRVLGEQRQDQRKAVLRNFEVNLKKRLVQAADGGNARRDSDRESKKAGHCLDEAFDELFNSIPEDTVIPL